MSTYHIADVLLHQLDSSVLSDHSPGLLGVDSNTLGNIVPERTEVGRGEQYKIGHYNNKVLYNNLKRSPIH